MQNVYDLAHELARSLRETDQYKNFVAADKEVRANESVSKMIEDFQKKQLELQSQASLGIQPEQEALDQLQSLYAILTSDPTASNYMQSYMAFSQVMMDILGIIDEVGNFDAEPEA